MSRQFVYDIPKPRFSGRARSKSYAMLAFRKYAHAVAFKKRFVGANYDAAYIGERGIERLENAQARGFGKVNEIEKGGHVLCIRIEHNGRADLMRAVGFIEFQLFDAEDESQIPLRFEVWNG